MKVKSESEVAQLCQTPSDPMNCSPPASSIHGIFQARVLEWGAIAFSEMALGENISSCVEIEGEREEDGCRVVCACMCVCVKIRDSIFFLCKGEGGVIAENEEASLRSMMKA